MRALLGRAQGLKEGDQHPFPWYTPICKGLAEFKEGPRSYDHLGAVRERAKQTAMLPDPGMEQVSRGVQWLFVSGVL